MRFLTAVTRCDWQPQTQPDIAILDINMPEFNGLDATAEFRQRLPDVKLLILSMHDDKEYIAAAIQHGARGYVLKDVSTREIVTAIEAVHNGGALLQLRNFRRPGNAAGAIRARGLVDLARNQRA